MSDLIALLFLVLLGWVMMAPIIIIPCWHLCRRSGYSPLLSLLLLIPYFGFVALVMMLQRPDRAWSPAGSKAAAQ